MSTFQQIGRSLGEVHKSVPQPFRKYRSFADDVWANSVLDPKTVEIVAVAVTHVTKCSYCVDYHTKKAKRAGASAEELVEAAVLSASIQANPLLLDEGSDYESKSKAAEEFFRYPIDEESFYLERKTKILIGLSVSIALKNNYSVSLFKEQATQNELSQEEIKESGRIASALLAGAAIRHLEEVWTAFAE
ncbi:carboxymuconolactone decarboxylase family protein [Sutcliffiella rhizosphaerae]|uniref:Carboxymuconolactone decarboxylase-like domain-containing protein n=1 Tax=Sutcliffiella rhizosphaerae TaxID=2880967 RepID=A0ABN8A7T2_9BACI|nr:carboxymuconolactone decarboxylase family protein [Sutcliffiella rhizosphaerae]CAG9621211.1 hypothetical protein BACCIP111883_01983 [Sutcliffiella rhizosphaerae]